MSRSLHKPARSDATCAPGLDESRLRAFAELAGDWLWETDAALRLTFVARGTADLSDAFAGASLGRALGDLAQPDLIGTALDAHVDDIAQHRAFRDVRYVRRDPDGRATWLTVSGQPMLDRAGAFAGYRGIARDVTALAEAERAARDSAARIWQIVDRLPAGVAYVDASHTFRFVNATLAEWYCTTVDDMVDRRVAELAGPDVYAGMVPHIQKALAGQHHEYEIERRFADDRTRLINNKYVPHANDAGEIVGFFVLAADVTEQRAAEAALRNSERQLRLVADAMPALIAYCDRDLRYTFANRTAARYYDRSVEQIVGRSAIDSVGGEAAAALIPYAKRALAGEEVTFEGARQFPDGTWRQYQTTYVPDRDDSGNVKGFFLLLVDITKHKQAEARVQAIAQQLKLVVDAVPAMIAYCDRERRYRVVSKTMAEWVGRPEHEIIGKTPNEIFGPRAHTLMQPNIERLMRGERIEHESTRDFPDGQQRVLSMTLIPDQDESGTVHGWFALGIDVTRRKQAQAVIEQQKQALEQLNQQKDRLFSIIAHDVRGAFNPILGFAEVLQMPAVAASRDKSALYAAHLHGAAKHAYGILEDLLTWSRAQLRDLRAELSDFDVAPLARDLQDKFEAQARAANLTVKLDVADGATVHADPEMIRTVLRNLAANAIKFTPEGGQVTIGAAPCDAGVEIAVVDTGVGMDADTRAHLFELGRSRTTPGLRGEPGTGLGLQICKELLDRLGTRLAVESSPGLGSRFSFVLPAAESAALKATG